MAFLKIVSGEAEGARIEIDQDEISIGRAPDNMLTIPSTAASSRHCQITRDGRAYTVKDLNSTNGTSLNGTLVREARLKPEDVITVGGIEILFDGDDVDVDDIPPELARGPSNTVMLSSFQQPTEAGRPASFGTRKNSKRTWIGLIVVLSVLAFAALAVFVVRILAA